MSGAPAGYIEVGERIQKFYERFPEGSLVAHHKPYLETIGERTFIVYCAAAYRTPDDRKPGIGYAWEPVPGPTPFTKDSELMNAETSAWGRAIAACGFETRNGIATREEVQARTGNGAAKPKLSMEQYDRITVLMLKLEQEVPLGDGAKSWVEQARDQVKARSRAEMTPQQADELIAWLEGQLDEAKIPF